MCHGNKELTARFTRFYQALLLIMHIQVVYKYNSTSKDVCFWAPQFNKFIELVLRFYNDE